MPYISNRRRFELDDDDNPTPQTAGELNYLLTSLIRKYFNGHKNYQAINDVIGALEGAKLEFYRRIAAPYEDTKISSNGDVY